MTSFNYLTLFTKKTNLVLKHQEQLRIMGLLKKLITRYKAIGWTEADFTEVYVKVIEEVKKSGFVNFSYVYGPLRGIVEEVKPKMVSNEGMKFDEQFIKEEVERYRKYVLERD